MIKDIAEEFGLVHIGDKLIGKVEDVVAYKGKICKDVLDEDEKRVWAQYHVTWKMVASASNTIEQITTDVLNYNIEPSTIICIKDILVGKNEYSIATDREKETYLKEKGEK